MNFVRALGLMLFVCLLLTPTKAACSSTYCVLSSGNLRFGTGTENSVNTWGGLQQAFGAVNCLDSTTQAASFCGLYKTTYLSYGMEMHLGTGDTGSSWHLNSVVADLSGYQVQSSSTDYSGFITDSVAGSAASGHGSITASRTFVINSVSYTINHVYTVKCTATTTTVNPDCQYVKVVTTVTNNSGNISVKNVNLWVGFRDNWIGNADFTYVDRGNLAWGTVDAVYHSIQSTGQSSNAILAYTNLNTNAGVALFYSSSATGTQSVYAACCDFSYVPLKNPDTCDPFNSETLTDFSYGI